MPTDPIPVPDGEVALPTEPSKQIDPAAAVTTVSTGGEGTDVHGTGSSPAPAPPNPLLGKYTEYWDVLKENPNDFPTWEKLIQTVEKLDDLEKIRNVFDAFLAEYPLCYGYWRKYADAEKRHGHPDMTAQVYERGVASIPYSVDLWGHYITFKQQLPDSDSIEIRRIFERGAAYVGTDYLAHGLWDKYVVFEMAQGNYVGVAGLYSRILACPLRDLDRFHTGFKELCATRSASELISAPELQMLRTELEKQKEAAAAAAAEAAVAAAPTEPTVPLEGSAEASAEFKEEPSAATAAVKAEEELVKFDQPDAKMISETDAEAVETVKGEPDSDVAAEVKEFETAEAAVESAPQEEYTVPEEVRPKAAAANGDAKPMDVDEAAQPTEIVHTEVMPTETMQRDVTSLPPMPPVCVVTEDEVKHAWVQVREDLYQNTKQELVKRKPFEDLIKRPYFHVKPLDATQLSNWKKYLDFIEQRGDEGAIITLYERCLVACASYPEFWQRYVRYLEGVNMEHATGALQRATMIYCKRRPEIHIFAARFEERHGRPESAGAVYKAVLNELSPRLLTAICAAANFERRQGNKEGACAYYEDLIKEEKSKEKSKIYPFLCMQYAQFLNQTYKDHDKARQVLSEALEACPTQKHLWEAAIFLEENLFGLDQVQRVVGLYETCTAPPPASGKGLPEKDREELSQRCLEFVDMFGDPETLLQVEKLHAARFLLPTSLTESRKRSSAEVAGTSAPPAPKVAKTEGVTPAPPPAAPHPPAPAGPVPAAAGYYPPAAPGPAPPYGYGSYGYGQYPPYGYGYGY